MQHHTVKKIPLQHAVSIALGLAIANVANAQLEEVVVTAQKRTESVQDVPIAINAMTGDSLREMGVGNTDDLAAMFPNLSLKAFSGINSGFSIRGVGSQNYHTTAQQAVGTYVDEVSLVSPFVNQLAFFDLERVEVLRGPQNTLFGRNTTGGAVNIISVKPTTDGFEGFANARLGNEGRADIEAAVNIPLGDSLAARLAIQSTSRDAIYHDVIDDEDTGAEERLAGRLQVLWQPGEMTDVLFNFHGGYNHSDRTPRKALGKWQEGSDNIGTAAARGPADCPLLLSSDPERFTQANNCVTATNGTVLNPSTPNRWRDVNDVSSNLAEVDFEGAFVKVTHGFESIELTSITSYDKIDVFQADNYAGAGVVFFHPMQDATYEVWSQELRFASTDAGDLQWIGGAYYSHEEDDLGIQIRNATDGTPPFTVVPSVIIPQEVDIFSVYGQFDYALTESLTLTAGLRWTSDEKSGVSTSRVGAGTTTGRVGAPVAPADAIFTNEFMIELTDAGAGACPPPVGGLPCILSFDVDQTLEEWGGRLSLDWAFSDNAMAYASYSRGFKSGAFDTRALAAFAGNADQPVGPEFLDAFEVGMKSTSDDATLELNGALFFYLWEDLQTFAVDDSGAPAFLNVPETELYGAEIELKWAPGNDWYIQGGIGYNHSEITDAGGLNTVKEGAVLAHSPEWTASGLVRKEFMIGNSILGIQSNVSYTDKVNSSNFESPYQWHDSTLYVNARINYVFGDAQQFELALWGENLTEQKACAMIAEDGTLTNGASCLMTPGMAFYGVSGQVNF